MLVFIVRMIQNGYVYLVGKMLKVLQVVQVVHIVTVGPSDVILTIYIKTYTWNFKLYYRMWCVYVCVCVCVCV